MLRERADNVSGSFVGDEAGAVLGEVKTDSVGTASDGLQGIFEIGDAADFNKEVLLHERCGEPSSCRARSSLLEMHVALASWELFCCYASVAGVFDERRTRTCLIRRAVFERMVN